MPCYNSYMYREALRVTSQLIGSFMFQTNRIVLVLSGPGFTMLNLAEGYPILA